ncbi:IS21 family transposase [Parasporobacterium paucivorans]|uniref:Transposase n=4 Tax=Parasporobacterium paucivorans DSM 15970 TaxID=1122934 RepID=A0A1M6LTT7_9FIRM|nr:IS21 family transposase [Parasporobacterium paucivorans]SHJ74550.1 Transposase [Parasporobacterium paucivorans DSM 15970]
MVNYRDIIRLKSLDYSNVSVASSSGSSRNTVAEVWKLAQDINLGWPIPDTLTDKDIGLILYPDRGVNEGRKLPDFEYIYNELAKPGVTLTLLWSEYCAKCEAEQAIPYQHTQFNEKYHAYAASKKATLRIKRKPGELMEVDWVGDTLTVFDEAAGGSIKAYIFVACLPCSLYSYAEAFPDMKSNHWIDAHVHAYSFFGGVTRILVPDNLKTGVIKNTRTELVLNRSYHEMAEHYGTAIIPARPVKPRDKSNAEGTVGVLETWILAALRNRKFFSFEELNRAIREKLQEFNEKSFQKKKGSRLAAFEEEEKNFLLPLPASSYETAIWSKATIQPDYLINIGDCKYSVPYEFIGKGVEIRSTEKSIEVFFHGNRIASHVRVAYSPNPIYTPEHMPENHRKYLAYNAESFQEWAENVGASTLLVVKNFLFMHKVEQQGYKPCASLMKLADRYSMERLEKACEKALSYTPSPSLKNISTILKNGQDKVAATASPADRCTSPGITRGAAYFKGGDR